jgi:hypothetical protein
MNIEVYISPFNLERFKNYGNVPVFQSPTNYSIIKMIVDIKEVEIHPTTDGKDFSIKRYSPTPPSTK